jgi:hypothetical protein
VRLAFFRRMRGILLLKQWSVIGRETKAINGASGTLSTLRPLRPL